MNQRVSEAGARARRDAGIALLLLDGLLLAHLTIYVIAPPSDLDLGSAFKVAIGLIAALVYGAIGVLAILGRAPTLAGRWFLPAAVTAIAVVLTVALIPTPPLTTPHLIAAHVQITLILSGWVLLQRLFPAQGDRPLARRWLVIALISAVVITAIRIYGLSYAPFVDVQDEAWVTAWTVGGMETGRLSDSTLGGLGEAYYAYPRYYWLLAGWYSITGVDLWSGRLLGLLLTLLVIPLTAWTAKQWFGTRAALMTGAALFASAILFSAARVRHDVPVAIALAGSLALVTLAWKRRSHWLHCAAGVLMLIGTFGHYHAVGLGAVLIVGLYAPILGARIRADGWRPIVRATWQSGAIAYTLGCIAGGLLVLVVQMLPDDLPGWLYALGRQTKYSASGDQFLIALFGNVFNIAWFSIFEFLLIGAGVVVALRRRTRFDVMLLLLLVLGHIALAIMGSGAIYYYILPLVPIYGLLIGRALAGGRADTDNAGTIPTDAAPVVFSTEVVRAGGLSRLEVVRALLLLAPLIGVTSGGGLAALVSGTPREPSPPTAVAWVRENVALDSEVVADMHYYFWLRDYTFTSHLVPDFLTAANEVRFDSAEQVWEAVAADYVIVDPAFERSYRKYLLPLTQTDLIARDYTLAIEIPSDAGNVQIYQRQR